MRQSNTNVLDMSIGQRIRTERMRLGMSQQKFAELCGVAKATQVAYEAGRRVPDLRYIHALIPSETDVVFIATGKHAGSRSLDRQLLRPVVKVVSDWLRVTDREVTPSLLEQVIGLLYDVALLNNETKATEGHDTNETLVRILDQQMKLVG